MYDFLTHNQSQQLYVQRFTQAWRNATQLYDQTRWLAREPDLEFKMLQDVDIAHALNYRQALIAGRDYTFTPSAEDSEKADLAVELVGKAFKGIHKLTASLKILSRAFFSGSRWAYIHGESRVLGLGDGKRRTWWMPTRLEDVAKERLRKVGEWDPEKKVARAYWEQYDIGGVGWEPVTVGTMRRLIYHTYDDDEASFGYGRGLRDALAWVWYAKANIAQERISASERFAQGLVHVSVDGLRDAESSLPNSDIIAEYVSLIENMRARHVLVTDKSDTLNIHQPSGTGHQILSDQISDFRTQIFTIVLGANLTTGASEGGSYALAKVQEDSTETMIQADRAMLSEAVTHSLVQYFWEQNAANLKELGLYHFMPEFQITQEKKSDPLVRAQVATTLAGAGMQISVDDVREQTGFRKPKKGEEVLEAPQQPQGPPPGGGGGGFPFRERAQFSEWDESKHSRADDGKFGSGGGASTSDSGQHWGDWQGSRLSRAQQQKMESLAEEVQATIDRSLGEAKKEGLDREQAEELIGEAWNPVDVYDTIVAMGDQSDEVVDELSGRVDSFMDGFNEYVDEALDEAYGKDSRPLRGQAYLDHLFETGQISAKEAGRMRLGHKRALRFAEWDESKHSRADDGKFGSGPGSGGGGEEKGEKASGDAKQDSGQAAEESREAVSNFEAEVESAVTKHKGKIEKEKAKRDKKVEREAGKVKTLASKYDGAVEAALENPGKAQSARNKMLGDIEKVEASIEALGDLIGEVDYIATEHFEPPSDYDYAEQLEKQGLSEEATEAFSSAAVEIQKRSTERLQRHSDALTDGWQAELRTAKSHLETLQARSRKLQAISSQHYEESSGEKRKKAWTEKRGQSMRAQNFAEWDESKHSRADDGKFGSGPGDGGGGTPEGGTAPRWHGVSVARVEKIVGGAGQRVAAIEEQVGKKVRQVVERLKAKITGISQGEAFEKTEELRERTRVSISDRFADRLGEVEDRLDEAEEMLGEYREAALEKWEAAGGGGMEEDEVLAPFHKQEAALEKHRQRFEDFDPASLVDAEFDRLADEMKVDGGAVHFAGQWDESKHSRADDGKFGSGPGEGGSGPQEEGGAAPLNSAGLNGPTDGNTFTPEFQQGYSEWSESLSKQETQAILDYSKSEFGNIKDVQTGLNKRPDRALKRTMANLQGAFDRAPKQTGTFYRGMLMPKGLGEKLKGMVGKTTETKSYSSWSADEGIMSKQGFGETGLGNERDESILWKGSLKSAVSIEKFSDYPEQRESITNKGTKMRIDKVEEQMVRGREGHEYKVYVVHATEV